MRKPLILLSLIAVLVSINTAYAFQLTGTVTRVLDGDTLHFLPDGGVPAGVKVHKDGTVSVRLRGIDAPEKRQA